MNEGDSSSAAGSDSSDKPEIRKGSVFETEGGGIYAVLAVRGGKAYYRLNGKVEVAPVEEFQQLLVSQGAKPLRDDHPTPEEISKIQNLDRIYRDLGPDGRYYVVSRWDREEGLQPTDERLNYRDHAPLRRRQRRIWTAFAVVAALLLWWWHDRYVLDYQRGQAARYVLNLMKERSQKENPELKNAITQAEREYTDYLESLREEREY
jgi:hypothetical protein